MFKYLLRRARNGFCESTILYIRDFPKSSISPLASAPFSWSVVRRCCWSWWRRWTSRRGVGLVVVVADWRLKEVEDSWGSCPSELLLLTLSLLGLLDLLVVVVVLDAQLLLAAAEVLETTFLFSFPMTRFTTIVLDVAAKESHKKQRQSLVKIASHDFTFCHEGRHCRRSGRLDSLINFISITSSDRLWSTRSFNVGATIIILGRRSSNYWVIR